MSFSTPTNLAEYYAHRAPEYDRIYDKPERLEDLQKIEQYVAREFKRLHVLEVACGTGYWTRIVAAVAASLVGTDLVDATLAVARAREQWPATVEFARADAFSLESNAAVAARSPFSGALAAFWVSHIERARLSEFLTNLHRVLEPQATVMLLDNRYIAGSSTPISRADEGGNTYQTRSLSDGTQYDVLKNFPQPADLLEALSSAGGADLSEARVDLLAYYWIMRYRLR